MTYNYEKYDENEIDHKKIIEKYNHEKKVWGNTSIGFSIASGGMIYKASSLLNGGEIGLGIYIGAVAFGCGYLAYKSGKKFCYAKFNREKCIKDLIIKKEIQYYKD